MKLYEAIQESRKEIKELELRIANTEVKIANTEIKLIRWIVGVGISAVVILGGGLLA